jgi:4-diphosphocytidyl-2-C-methyl-D-erythritol kinase
MSSERATTVRAYAKVNLTLAVLGKRADGYHNLASVMRTVSLRDTLLLAPTRDGVITCETDVPALNSADNLALRAAELLRVELGDAALGARIELRKGVPIQGGMGGGSGDAGSVLLALNRLWDANLPDERLAALAARLGSDVPFFIHGGMARIAGRGEIVTPLPDAEPLWLALAKPPVSISTAAVFRRLTPDDYGTAEDTDAIERAIRAGAPLPFERLTNSLEPVVLAAYPEVRATRDALLAMGAPLVRISGSGPTLFAPFRERSEATAIVERAGALGIEAWLCRTIGREEYHLGQRGAAARSRGHKG